MEETTTGTEEYGDHKAEEKHTPPSRQLCVPPQKILMWAPCPFRRTPRRILPPRHLRALPRPVSAKRLVSAIVLKGPWYLMMLLVMVLFVVVMRGYCERFGCGYGYGCYSVVWIYIRGG
jgi:hypothetical protein